MTHPGHDGPAIELGIELGALPGDRRNFARRRPAPTGGQCSGWARKPMEGYPVLTHAGHDGPAIELGVFDPIAKTDEWCPILKQPCHDGG